MKPTNFLMGLSLLTVMGCSKENNASEEEQKSHKLTELVPQAYLDEAKDMGFDEAREKARDAWNSYLGRIRVEGGSAADRIKFYTGLYHALLGRGLGYSTKMNY